MSEVKGSAKNESLKVVRGLLKAKELIKGPGKTRVNQDLMINALDIATNPKGVEGLSNIQKDQLRAKILSNEKAFKAWGYYNMAKKIADKAKGGSLLDAFLQVVSPNVDAPIATGPFRPPQWNGLPSDLSQLVLVKTNIGGYFFDAILREEHKSTIKITSHPVQTGANITDHSYVEPAVVVLEIGMSDAMDSLVAGQFTSRYTKSVSAFQALLDMQVSRIPVSVHTRVRTYNNMLIEDITTPDDSTTLAGLRCSVTLREIFLVEVTKTTVPAREQTTEETGGGAVQVEEATPSVASKVEKAIKGG